MIKENQFHFNPISYKEMDVTMMINANLPLDIIYATESNDGLIKVFRNAHVLVGLMSLQNRNQEDLKKHINKIILRMVIIKEGSEEITMLID